MNYIASRNSGVGLLALERLQRPGNETGTESQAAIHRQRRWSMVASWKGMSNSGDRSPYNPAPDYVRINKLKAISNRVTK